MRRKKLSKIAAVSLAFTLCVGTFSGCEKKDGEKSGSGDDLYSVMEEAQDLKCGNFEMTLGAEVKEGKDSEKLELGLSGVTTQESFDVEVSLNMKTEDLTTKGVVTQLIYEDEHLYINLADTMDFLNSVEEIGELSDLGITEDYFDLYVGDIFEQTDETAAEEMAGLMAEILEDAAVATDKKAGAAKNGKLEFKDEKVLDFIGNLFEGIKDNADEIVDFSIESSQKTINYDKIFDYYGDLFKEYDIDIEEYKDQLAELEEIEISKEEKETMIEEIESSCDEVIDSIADSDKDDVKGSKLLVQASLDGKKGKRNYELNFEMVGVSVDDGDEVRLYLDYTFEEDEKASVTAPKESIDVEGLLEVFGPFLQGSMGPVTEPEIDPGVDEPKDFVNEDGSVSLDCGWEDCTDLGKVDYVAPAGYTLDLDFSSSDLVFFDKEDGSSMSISVYNGTDYKDGTDYGYIQSNSENAPTGTITTPLGDMEYIVDNSNAYYSIFGYVLIDAEHYVEIEYTVYSVNEPTEEKMINGLTEIANGLKAVQ